MKHPEVLRRYGEIGVVGVGSIRQELDRFWRQQLDDLGKIVKDANVEPRPDPQRQRQAGTCHNAPCHGAS
jgi:hypothetical protein